MILKILAFALAVYEKYSAKMLYTQLSVYGNKCSHTTVMEDQSYHIKYDFSFLLMDIKPVDSKYARYVCCFPLQQKKVISILKVRQNTTVIVTTVIHCNERFSCYYCLTSAKIYDCSSRNRSLWPIFPPSNIH